MKYLTKFENHTQYEEARQNLILPNVSLCEQENEVHYNPSTPVPPAPTETRVVAKYYVESEGDIITLFYIEEGSGSGSGSGSGGEVPFSSMEIDGVELSEVVNQYTFNTVGEHTVKYTLTDPASISERVFIDCSGLTSIEIPNSVTSIGESAFNGCSNLTSIDIPNSVTSISERVFQDCTSLTSCAIGSSVTSIGQFAFYYCTSLTSITSLAMTAPTIQSSTFSNVKTGGTLTVPSGSSGYNVWMGTSNYYLGRYGWTKVEQ